MADLKFYDVIERPVITENSMSVLDEKKYTFIVHPEATKAQIKEEVCSSAKQRNIKKQL